jgi:hypothetical protein
MTAVLKDDAELYKQFSDNPDFRRWLTDMVCDDLRQGGRGARGLTTVSLSGVYCFRLYLA